MELKVIWESDRVLVNNKTRNFEDVLGYGLTKERRNEAFQFALSALKNRLDHCAITLNTMCQKEDTKYNSWGAFWENGHFSMPVYTAIKEFLASKPKDWKDINNRLLAQQIVRAIDSYDHFQERDDAFNIITEVLILI